MDNRRVRLNYSWLWIPLLLIIACSKANCINTERNTSQTEQLNNITSANVLLSKADIKKLTKRYANKNLEIIDVSHVVLDGASSLVITFNIPIDAEQNFAHYIDVIDNSDKKQNIYDGWELSPKQTELRRRYLEPEKEYSVKIRKGIKAINGKQLNHASEVYTVKTPAIFPIIGFVSRGSLFPAKVLEGLPIVALNVNSVDVDFYRIKPDLMTSFISTWQNKTSMERWDAEDYLRNADLVYGARFDLHIRPNIRENILLPLRDAKALQQPGIYLAVMRRSGNYNDYTLYTTLFTLSDIGVSVHRTDKSLDIFAQSLENGKSLSDVKIQLLDHDGNIQKEGQTDKLGHIRFDYANEKPPELLIATQHGQTSIITLNTPALDLTEFTLAGPNSHDLQFFVFGPRNIYRPGENVILNALLRNIDGKALPPRPIKVDILYPNNKVAHSFVWQPSEAGFYQSYYTLPDNAPTGNWQIRFELGDNSPRFYAFKVEEFLPERMTLDIDSSDAPLDVDTEIVFDITGRYLYGAPAAGNKLQGQLLLRPLRNAVPTLPYFYFGEVNEKLARRLSDIDTTLNRDGKTAIITDNNWSDIKSPASVILQASLFESGGRPVTRTVYQPIWPVDQLPGIRPLFGQKDVYNYNKHHYTKEFSVDENSYAEFEIVYSNAKGQKLAVDNLDVRLIYERHDYYWNWSEYDGWHSGYTEHDIVQDTTQVSIKDGQTIKVGFLVDWGSYRLEVTDPETGAVSSIRFWAGYSWQDNTTNRGGTRPDQVKMKLDKASYKVGEKVKLTVEAPQAGNGYLVVESSEGVLWWREINVPEGGAQFEIPIDNAWQRHDLYLSALVIRPGDKRLHATPKRAVGILHLPMANNDRKLNITLNAPAKIEPNQTVSIKVKVDGQQLDNSKPIKVLVSAVDIGVLNITQFQTPDPYNSFFGRKAYAIDQFDVYGQLIEGKGRIAKLRYGGDGEDDEGSLISGGKRPVSKVVIVALQADPVTVDENGEAIVTLAIPDFNGELRLMAQAWSDDKFGSSESKLVVASPLTLELGAPRFMANGDQSQLALDITNLSDEIQTIKIDTKVSGLLQLVLPITNKITLEQGKKTTLSIPVKATKGFGQGHITVMVTGSNTTEGEKIELLRTWTIGVRPAQPAKTRSEMISLLPGEKITSSLLDSLMSDLDIGTTDTELSLTTLPPINLSYYLRQLYAYPYGCAEQTTSGLYPSLYLTSEQLTALNIEGSNDEERRKNIKIGIQRLLGMQRHNGSFGLWSSSSPEEYWVSVYVTDFLLRAREQGYEVPEAALNKAISRLSTYIQERNLDIGYSDDTEYTKFAVQSYAALVLARQQKAPLSHLRRLYDTKVKEISGLPAIQLGIALHLMGDKQRGDLLINQGIHITRKDSNKWWYHDYGSNIRDSALIISLLNENKLLIDLTSELLLDLSNQLKNKKYLSTQELNAIYLAGRQLINKEQPAWQVELHHRSNQLPKVLNKTQPTLIRMTGQQFDDLTTINNIGDNTLYTTINVIGYSKNPQKPERNKLKIQRNYLDLKGDLVDVANLKSGELIIVKLTVSTEEGKQINDALVVDLLPAGLELENQNLTNSASLSNNSTELATLMQKMQQTTIANQEFKDDRYIAAITVGSYRPAVLLYLARAVTPGSYIVPAPMVESMYQPELYAIGNSVDKLTVH